MFTSLLYHGVGLAGYRHVRQHFQEGEVIFHIEKPRERLCCPHCGNVPRVWCGPCGYTRQIKLGFADPS